MKTNENFRFPKQKINCYPSCFPLFADRKTIATLVGFFSSLTGRQWLAKLKMFLFLNRNTVVVFSTQIRKPSWVFRIFISFQKWRECLYELKIFPLSKQKDNGCPKWFSFFPGTQLLHESRFSLSRQEDNDDMSWKLFLKLNKKENYSKIIPR